MTNSKFKLLLDNLRALILKSRPAYRDYIGTEDIIEKTVLISGKLSADGESVNAKDAFKGFAEGETYKVTIGEETVEATAQYGNGSFSGCIVIGSSNVMPSKEIPGWMICVYNENLLGYGTGEWASKSVEVVTEKTAKVDRWDVKKLSYELLPNQLFVDLNKVARQCGAQIKAAQVNPVFVGSFSQNRMAGTDVGDYSHAEGIDNTASGESAHAEGRSTTASSYSSHAEGWETTASGDDSHAEGWSTVANNYHSHAEGHGSVASGESAHAEGDFTIASGRAQHAEGMWNIGDGAKSNLLHIVGNGTAVKRSNAHTLDKSGNAWYAGDVYVGSTSGTNKDAGSKKLATEEYVDSRLFTFTITPVDGQVSPTLSATRAEMLAAIDAGKTVLGYWTETRTILDTTDTIKHEFRLESVTGTGASRGLAFVNYEQFYKSTLYVNGNDTISFVDKEVLPAPMTKTDVMTQSVGMDDDGRLWTEPGASGLPEGATAFQQLVTDSNGNTMWEDRPGGYTQKFTGDYVYTKSDDFKAFSKFCAQNEYDIGDTITVVCNGVTYESVPITANNNGGIHLEQAGVFSFGNVAYYGAGIYNSVLDTFPDGVTSVTFKNVHQTNDVLIPLKYLPTDLGVDEVHLTGALKVDRSISTKWFSTSTCDVSEKVDFVDGNNTYIKYVSPTDSTWHDRYMLLRARDVELRLMYDGRLMLVYSDNVNKDYDVLIKGVRTPVDNTDAANKKYVDDTKLIVSSSTAGSTKKFKITVDDAGTLTATEITTA